MTTKYGALTIFITENLKNKEKEYLKFVLEKMKIIEPLLNFDRWKFGTAENLKHPEMIKSLRLFTGKKINKIVPISVYKPLFDKPEWMSDEKYKYDIKDSFGKDELWMRIWERAPKSSDYDFEKDGALRKNLSRELKEEDFMNYLENDFKNSPWINLGGNLKQNFCINVVVSLFYFLYFILIGHIEKAEQFAPLMQQLADGYYPIEEKTDERETILVLVA